MKRSPVKKTNPKRRKQNFARAYGSKQRVAWVQAQPCLIGLLCLGRVENAHVGNGGMARKADANHIVPLCARHHDELHTTGTRTFEKRWGITLSTEADRLAAQWESTQSAVPDPLPSSTV